MMYDSQINILKQPLTIIPKLGEKTAAFLAKIGLKTLSDLIFHFPSNIRQYKKFPKFHDIVNGDYILTKVTIDHYDQKPAFKIYSKRPFKIYCYNEQYSVNLIYFNFYPNYIINNINPGDIKYIVGRAEIFNGLIQIAHPDYILNENELSKLPLNEVIYPLTYGVTNKQLQSYINTALKYLNDIEEWIDEEYIKQNNWPSFSQALKNAHTPQNQEELLPTNINKQRLAYDELLAQQIAINIMKHYKTNLIGQKFVFSGELYKKIINDLGFELTPGQKEAINDICNDQRSANKMIRLIQGDVGSGKTLVALAAMINIFESGQNIQSCLMTPTDVLSTQHFENFNKLLSKYDIKIGLLTGKIKGKKRTQILEELKNGKIDILIGTHALFQEKVIFQNLGLIIIDEQHRFGVNQRAALYDKGNNPDLLIMSATPIPRTLTLALYGDMEISRITDKPQGRLPIITTIKPVNKISQLYQSLKKNIEENNQIYWICPLIDNQEEDATAINRYEEFTKIFGHKVGLVHGKMKAEEKENNIKNFANGEYKILVATTVIEVGIDVPNASIIVIEEADKFGLSQLHQLRGRVGRGNKQSYCLLLYSKQVTANSIERLKILKSSNDGFKIAEEDLKLRGSGDIVGNKQSGFPDFKVANFIEHQNLLIKANEQAKNITTNSNPINLDHKYLFLLKLFGLESRLFFK